MAVTLGMVTFDCRDARSLASWWARQTGGEVVADHDGWFLMVSGGAGMPVLGFQQLTEPTPGKNRLHLDMVTADRELEVERLLTEGALEVARHETALVSWVVLSDPEGNQFCVSQRR